MCSDRRRHRHRGAWRPAALLGACTLVASCELAETTVPSTASVVVVHGILSANAVSQLVLLERSWNGEHPVITSGPPYNPGDPVGSGSGFPEISAAVEVTTPDGETLRGSELRLLDARFPAGVYSLPIPATAIAAGGRYQLSVRTSAGETLGAATTVPAAWGAGAVVVRPFDRTGDSLVLQWPVFAAARGYQLRIETPYGPYTALTERQDVRVSGSLRNVFVEGLPRVFFPGFRQLVTVSAVDSNYYDFFRSSNNFYSGRGLISRVAGGLGVFGAIARAAQYQLRVSAPFVHAIEGEYHYLGTAEDSARTLVIGLTLYVDARGARADQPDALSGAFRARLGSGIVPADTLGGLLGIRFADSLRVAFLSQQSVRDTLDVFRAQVRGDTLVGRYSRRAGTWRFVRRPSGDGPAPP